MPVVIVEGPEKAGKTTFIARASAQLESEGYTTKHRKWGQISPDDRVYGDALFHDVYTYGDDPKTAMFWDRAWASEEVYGQLMHRNKRRAVQHKGLMAWLWERALVGNGVKIMFSADPDKLKARRDDTDLPVDPIDEVELFNVYGDKHGWAFLEQGEAFEHKYATLKGCLARLSPSGLGTTVYSGPSRPHTIFIDNTNEDKLLPGAVSPLSTLAGHKMAGVMSLEGFNPLEYGYATAGRISPKTLKELNPTADIITLGERATQWARHTLRPAGFEITSAPAASHLHNPLSLKWFIGALHEVKNRQIPF